MPQYKGFLGELKIRFIIHKTNKYAIHNIIIKDENGKTTQIDHIVINKSGIFVIETKNYSGIIKGTDSDYQWTQFLKGGYVQNKIYNPVLQNKTHIYMLKKLLKTTCPFYSAVVLTRNNISQIKSYNIFNTATIQKFINCNFGTYLTQEEIEHIYQTLSRHKKANNHLKKEHIKNAQMAINNPNLTKEKCPRCGGILIIRNSEYGEFLGCSNYPNCRFTKNTHRAYR